MSSTTTVSASVDEDFVNDYSTSLNELTTNSKPHINMLTLLADEGQSHSDKIVELIENRIYKVDKSQKLPLLYLIDSIVKNCSDGPYREKFAKNIINVFAHVFSKADDEKVRGSMFKLRETWSAIFPTTKLLFLDMKINGIDPAWPLRLPAGSSTSSRVVIPPAPTPATAASTSTATTVASKPPTSIHLNPKFLNKSDDASTSKVPLTIAAGDPRLRTAMQTQQPLQKSQETVVQKSREIVKEAPLSKDMPRVQSLVRPVNSALLNAVKESRSSKDAAAAAVAARKTPKIDNNENSTRKDNLNNVLVNSAADSDKNSKKIKNNGQKPLSADSAAPKKSDFSSSKTPRDDSMLFAFDHTPRRRLAHETQVVTLVQSKPAQAPIRPAPKVLKPSPKIATHNIEEEDEEEEEEDDYQIVAVAKKTPPMAAPKDEDYRNFAQMPRRKAPANLRRGEQTADSSPEETEKRKFFPTEQQALARKNAAAILGRDAKSSKGDVDLRYGLGAAQTFKPSPSTVDSTDDNLPIKKRRRGLDEAVKIEPVQVVAAASSSSITRRPLLGGKSSAEPQRNRPLAAPQRPPARPQQQPLMRPQPPPQRRMPAPSTVPKRPRMAPPGGAFANVPEIPSNNMIYVDGVEYPVGYVDRQPVIKKHGNVHRLHFSGLGRDVTIDDRKYFLKFDEQKEVLIDGHLHKIRFGGPSRELYMNDFAFRGSFGGAPIFATINDLKHKISLGGPAPEVKIDIEPAHDLKNAPVDFGTTISRTPAPQQQQQRMTAAQIGPVPMNFGYAFAGSVPVAPCPVVVPPLVAPATASSSAAFFLAPTAPSTAAAPASSTVNVADLLNKLVTTGFIAPKPAAPTAVKQPEQKPSSTARTNSKATASIPTYEDPTLVAVDLSSLDLPILKRRYASIIRALYKDEGFVCAHCGVRFDESKQQKYANHLDWHFNQSKFGAGANDRRRKWYLVDDDWANYEEFRDDKTPKAKSKIFESEAKKRKSKEEKVVSASTNSVIIADDEHTTCAVCFERFEQFWDEEEETWKLRNAMLIDDTAYHPLCYEDTLNSTVDHPTNESSSLKSDDIKIL